jgi:16S rRNA (cytosine967-C5)-methyltransferase
MRPGARAQAAIEILLDLETRRRPAADSVKDWMLSHRFAGSKDRAEIGDLVFGALRWKASSAYRFQDDQPRAWVFGAQRWGFGQEASAIEQACYDDPHAPPPPTEAERHALHGATLEGAPDWVRGDYPQWLDQELARAFGDQRAVEGAALAAPAPLDLRANRLKTDLDALITALADNPYLKVTPARTPHAPDGVRLPWRRGGAFSWASDPSFQKGWFEVQDEGSQLAALLSGVEPGMQVADVCAGGGGKTLALAALMGNRGQIFSYDIDGRRLAPLFQRVERAGVRTCQIRTPSATREALADLRGAMDLVFVDAPCSGSGTWRRAPDSKWRVRPNALAKRFSEQQQALDLAAPLVRPGGRLIYVTCSILPQENEDALAAFLARHPGFAMAPLRADSMLREAAYARGEALQMTPARTGCDGFFVAGLTKAAAV